MKISTDMLNDKFNGKIHIKIFAANYIFWNSNTFTKSSDIFIILSQKQ